VLVVVPHSTTATEIAEGSRTSSSAPKGRKHAADEDATQAEEAKRDQVEHHSEGLQGSPPLVVNIERHEDETGPGVRLRIGV
jgi:hypothetical protein